MSTITVLELQTDPAAILARVSAGEHLLVVSDGQTLAEIRPVDAPSGKLRPYGLAAGEFTVPADFDAPLPDDLLSAFNSP